MLLNSTSALRWGFPLLLSVAGWRASQPRKNCQHTFQTMLANLDHFRSTGSAHEPWVRTYPNLRRTEKIRDFCVFAVRTSVFLLTPLSWSALTAISSPFAKEVLLLGSSSEPFASPREIGLQKKRRHVRVSECYRTPLFS